MILSVHWTRIQNYLIEVFLKTNKNLTMLLRNLAFLCSFSKSFWVRNSKRKQCLTPLAWEFKFLVEVKSRSMVMTSSVKRLRPKAVRTSRCVIWLQLNSLEESWIEIMQESYYISFFVEFKKFSAFFTRSSSI